MPECDCGRVDHWHLPQCRSLSFASLEASQDGNNWVYRGRV